MSPKMDKFLCTKGMKFCKVCVFQLRATVKRNPIQIGYVLS